MSTKKDKKRKHSESSGSEASSGSEEEAEEEDLDEDDTGDKGDWVQIMKDGEEEFDEEGFGSDNEELQQSKDKKKSKGKPEVKKRKKKKSGDVEDAELLETADKFSSLIDATVSSKFDHMSMQALSNKDKAHHKQLQWEVDRDKWIRGRDDKSIIAAKKNKRHRWFSKKKGRGGKKK